MTTTVQKRTGLFFGSFNPIHAGHLIIAQYFTEFTGLEQLWFVVSPQNPFKANEPLLPGIVRLELVELAIKDNPSLFSCDVELHMKTPSYTINTLEVLKEAHADRSFVLIMGADNLQSLHHWKRHQEILDGFDIFVYPRPGYDMGGLVSHPRISVHQAPMMEISAAFIRQMIAGGKTPRYWLTEAVREKILKEGYYK